MSDEDALSTRLNTHRRSFLKTMLIAAGAAFLPNAFGQSGSAWAAADETSRRISLFSINTGDRFDGVYWADGHYLPDAMKKLQFLMRDHKTGQMTNIDPHLYDQLWNITQKLGLNEPIQVVCGYRTRKTNAMARRRSRAVAKQSLHMSGRAVDIRIKEKSIKELAMTAREMEAGGVGYYPRNGFVHIDTGPVRTW